MAWNIDEEYWPGPDEHQVTAVQFSRIIHTFGRRVGKALGLAGAAAEAAMEDLRKAFVTAQNQDDYMLWPPQGGTDFPFTGTLAEKKKYSLEHKQNRNTGPRSTRQFGHDGKKVY